MEYTSQRSIVINKANAILNIMRKRHNNTLIDIKKELDKDNPEPVSPRSLRRYINMLERTGYIVKIGVHTKTFRVISEGDFKYPEGARDILHIKTRFTRKVKP